MAHWVNKFAMQAWGPKFDPWNPCKGERRKLAPEWSPASALVLWQCILSLPISTHTITNKFKMHLAASFIELRATVWCSFDLHPSGATSETRAGQSTGTSPQVARKLGSRFPVSLTCALNYRSGCCTTCARWLMNQHFLQSSDCMFQCRSRSFSHFRADHTDMQYLMREWQFVIPSSCDTLGERAIWCSLKALKSEGMEGGLGL